METFGKILKRNIENSGYNIFQFAKITGINRVNIQRYISDQRFPSKIVYLEMLSYLHLNLEEQKELETAYSICSVGPALYFQREGIKKIFESFSDVYESEEQRNLYITNNYYQYEKPDNNIIKNQSVRGDIGVLRLFQREIIRITNTYTNPYIHLFLPVKKSSNFLKNALTEIGINFQNHLEIIQMFSMTSRVMNDDKVEEHNLEVLSTVLPMCFSRNFNYQAYYYYDNGLSSSKNIGLVFPYYAIMNDSMILYSQNMTDAMFCAEPMLLNVYQNSFIDNLKKCKCFTKTAYVYDDFVSSYLKNNNLVDQEFWLEYQPCLISVATPDMVEAILRKDLEGREKFKEKVLERLHQVQNRACEPYHFFTEKGLREFVETGTCMEFPKAYAVEFPKKYRLELLTLLIEACESEKQMLRIIDLNSFRIPAYLSTSVNSAAAHFYNVMKDNSWGCISLREPTLINALLDFFISLPEGPFLYTKEETLDILNRYIARLK